jgi:hypothetical protein
VIVLRPVCVCVCVCVCVALPLSSLGLIEDWTCAHEQENARTTSKFFEYDETMQTKGKELAKTHGNLAEARSLAKDVELRVQSMKVMEQKLRRDLKFG